MTPSIEVSNVSVVYRTKKSERRALDAVSFQADGSMIAMLGPNGAGKSTLMGVISGMIHPETGEVVAPRSNRELAIVFQTPALDELLTIRENIVLAGAMHAMSKHDSLARLAQLAEPLGIADRLNDQVRHLSGGLKRRADLARALISSPGILLLDEPTTGLDIEARKLFWDILATARTQHPMTILLATHLTEEAELAERVLLMREGKIIADDTPQTLKSHLGQRILRLVARDNAQHAAAIAWASEAGHYAKSSGLSMTIANADEPMLAECPLTDASMTLAPPTLADVYSWNTGAGELSINTEYAS